MRKQLAELWCRNRLGEVEQRFEIEKKKHNEKQQNDVDRFFVTLLKYIALVALCVYDNI